MSDILLRKDLLVFPYPSVGEDRVDSLLKLKGSLMFVVCWTT